MESFERICSECNYKCKHTMEGFAMVHPRTAMLHTQHDEHGKLITIEKLLTDTA